ncbi:MAG TPA: phage tail protein [Gemmatimonadaceae bacterium]|nr:phage tail protein [Gemmatimonadaceae bacterium]
MSEWRGDTTYRFVNLEHTWPNCRLTGIESDGGVLRLAHVPSRAAMLPTQLEDATDLVGPSRIGVASDGTVYVADPKSHRVVRIDPCTDAAEPLRCIAGPGSEIGELRAPRAVAVGPRDSLYVADTGNARVQVFDRRTGQVRAMIGGGDGGSTDATLRAPVDVALDSAGNVYVVDAATNVGGVREPGRVLKFDRRGRLVPSFWATMHASAPHPTSPVSAVIVPASGGGDALLVLDDAAAAAMAFTLDGAPDPATTAQWDGIGDRVISPGTAVHHDGVIYVSDAATARVLVFDANGAFLGVVRDLPSDAAGLAVDGQGRLIVQLRDGGIAQLGGNSFVETGVMVTGPFQHEPGPHNWFVAHCAATIPPNTHVQIFTCTEEVFAPGPLSPIDVAGKIAFGVDSANASSPTPVGRWRACPVDALDVVLLNEPEKFVWIAIALIGDGQATPTVTQIRLDDDATSWLDHLPTLYRRDDDTRDFLERALAIYKGEMDVAEAHLDDLLRNMDPWSAADTPDGEGSWLLWLAGWLAFPIAESWTEGQRRAATASAFALEATRGTAESLADLIALYSGAAVRITEPSGSHPVWALGTSSRLGVETMLPLADPHGTVLDTVAELDRSHLLDVRHEGAPPFAAMANRFCVEAFAADFATEASRRELVRVIEAEKPAHTTYHLCLLEAAMRVGAQARLGIDAIVAGPGGVCLTPSGVVLDDRSVLTDPHRSLPRGVVGRSARVGIGAAVT